jgi:hypothetical protein
MPVLPALSSPTSNGRPLVRRRPASSSGLSLSLPQFPAPRLRIVGWGSESLRLPQALTGSPHQSSHSSAMARAQSAYGRARTEDETRARPQALSAAAALGAESRMLLLLSGLNALQTQLNPGRLAIKKV